MQAKLQRSCSGRVVGPKYNETRGSCETRAHLCYLIKLWKRAHVFQRSVAESRSVDIYLLFMINTFWRGGRHIQVLVRSNSWSI